ncbi:MAG TPA: TonB-dependent receptor [Steroidobacteraceae bacterium]|nr:TonB-dependent receptor [Steroidobacteraceae bacterium]
MASAAPGKVCERSIDARLPDCLYDVVSKILPPRKRATAMETTAEGMAEAIVMPAKSPRYRLRAPSRIAPCAIWGPLLALTLLLRSADLVAAEPLRHFELPAGDAAAMLNEFSRQSELQVLFDFNLLRGLKTRAVHGDLDASDALRAMLAGTNLVFDFVNARTLAVRPRGARRVALRSLWPGSAASFGRTASREGLEQVLVSGAPESGAQPLLGAPVIELSRTDIDRSGLSTVQDFLRTLPQIFGGGPSEDTLLIGREAITNSARGAGVNLRGLDAGATLVLIDGHRVAPSGTQGTFTDISNIPLSAVDHIQVLPDGTNARYGADAVGGVVNFVMRSGLDGAQTQARAGSVTDGSLAERQFSQLWGTSWESGAGVVDFDFFQRDALRARDRAQETSDLTRFGGSNFDTPFGNPGTLTNGVLSWPLPTPRPGVPLSASSLKPGPPNLYDQDLGVDVTPRELRWSLFGKANLQPAEAVGLFAEGLFTSRRVANISTSANPLVLTVPSTNPFYINPAGGTAPVTVLEGSVPYFGMPEAHVHVDTGNFSIGAIVAAPYGWTLTGSLAYAFEEQLESVYGLADQAALDAALADPDPATAFNPFVGGAENNPATLAAIRRTGLFTLNSNLKTVCVTGVGPLGWLPAGAVQLTAGAEYRDQVFDTLTTEATPSPGYDPHSGLGRRISAAFGEMRVPLFGTDNERALARQLELSLGLRHEHYSDLGGITIPKLGFVWTPVTGLDVRGTWTRSFSPPNLPDIAVANSFTTLLTLPDAAAPSGLTTALVRFGSNPGLQPERARSWTLGADLTPAWLPALSVSLTYFNILFEGRVEDPLITADVLDEPEFAWLVTRNATQAAIDLACREGTFMGAPASCTHTPVGAIVDERLANIAVLRTTGIDLLGKYALPVARGRLELGLNGTYLFEYSSTNTPGGPATDLLSTQNNPINLRLRGSLAWSDRGLGTALYVNYDNSYRDTNSEPSRKVGSLRTLDVQLSYETGERAPGWLGHTRFALDVENVLDTYPPFLNNAVGVGYDQENADLLGRFVSLEVRRRW